MPVHAIQFAQPIVDYAYQLIQVALVVIAVVALVNSIVQRADAFTAAGKLSKPAWIGINAVSILGAILPIFQIFAITAVLVYLLDVRPAVREVSEGGSSSW
jgi:uncharacterized membrane protein